MTTQHDDLVGLFQRLDQRLGLRHPLPGPRNALPGPGRWAPDPQEFRRNVPFPTEDDLRRRQAEVLLDEYDQAQRAPTWTERALGGSAWDRFLRLAWEQAGGARHAGGAMFRALQRNVFNPVEQPYAELVHDEQYLDPQGRPLGRFGRTPDWVGGGPRSAEDLLAAEEQVRPRMDLHREMPPFAEPDVLEPLRAQQLRAQRELWRQQNPGRELGYLDELEIRERTTGPMDQLTGAIGSPSNLPFEVGVELGVRGLPAGVRGLRQFARDPVTPALRGLEWLSPAPEVHARGLDEPAGDSIAARRADATRVISELRWSDQGRIPQNFRGGEYIEGRIVGTPERMTRQNELGQWSTRYRVTVGDPSGQTNQTQTLSFFPPSERDYNFAERSMVGEDIDNLQEGDVVGMYLSKDWSSRRQQEFRNIASVVDPVGATDTVLRSPSRAAPPPAAADDVALPTRDPTPDDEVDSWWQQGDDAEAAVEGYTPMREYPRPEGVGDARVGGEELWRRRNLALPADMHFNDFTVVSRTDRTQRPAGVGQEGPGGYTRLMLRDRSGQTVGVNVFPPSGTAPDVAARRQGQKVFDWAQNVRVGDSFAGTLRQNDQFYDLVDVEDTIIAQSRREAGFPEQAQRGSVPEGAVTEGQRAETYSMWRSVTADLEQHERQFRNEFENLRAAEALVRESPESMVNVPGRGNATARQMLEEERQRLAGPLRRFEELLTRRDQLEREMDSLRQNREFGPSVRVEGDPIPGADPSTTRDVAPYRVAAAGGDAAAPADASPAARGDFAFPASSDPTRPPGENTIGYEQTGIAPEQVLRNAVVEERDLSRAYRRENPSVTLVVRDQSTDQLHYLSFSKRFNAQRYYDALAAQPGSSIRATYRPNIERVGAHAGQPKSSGLGTALSAGGETPQDVGRQLTQRYFEGEEILRPAPATEGGYQIGRAQADVEALRSRLSEVENQARSNVLTDSMEARRAAEQELAQTSGAVAAARREWVSAGQPENGPIKSTLDEAVEADRLNRVAIQNRQREAQRLPVQTAELSRRLAGSERNLREVVRKYADSLRYGTAGPTARRMVEDPSERPPAAVQQAPANLRLINEVGKAIRRLEMAAVRGVDRVERLGLLDRLETEDAALVERLNAPLRGQMDIEAEFKPAMDAFREAEAAINAVDISRVGEDASDATVAQVRAADAALQKAYPKIYRYLRVLLDPRTVVTDDFKKTHDMLLRSYDEADEAFNRQLRYLVGGYDVVPMASGGRQDIVARDRIQTMRNALRRMIGFSRGIDELHPQALGGEHEFLGPGGLRVEGNDVIPLGDMVRDALQKIVRGHGDPDSHINELVDEALEEYANLIEESEDAVIAWRNEYRDEARRVLQREQQRPDDAPADWQPDASIEPEWVGLSRRELVLLQELEWRGPVGALGKLIQASDDTYAGTLTPASFIPANSDPVANTDALRESWVINAAMSRKGGVRMGEDPRETFRTGAQVMAPTQVFGIRDMERAVAIQYIRNEMNMGPGQAVILLNLVEEHLKPLYYTMRDRKNVIRRLISGGDSARDAIRKVRAAEHELAQEVATSVDETNIRRAADEEAIMQAIERSAGVPVPRGTLIESRLSDGTGDTLDAIAKVHINKAFSFLNRMESELDRNLFWRDLSNRVGLLRPREAQRMREFGVVPLSVQNLNLDRAGARGSGIRIAHQEVSGEQIWVVEAVAAENESRRMGARMTLNDAVTQYGDIGMSDVQRVELERARERALGNIRQAAQRARAQFPGEYRRLDEWYRSQGFEGGVTDEEVLEWQWALEINRMLEAEPMDTGLVNVSAWRNTTPPPSATARAIGSLSDDPVVKRILAGDTRDEPFTRSRIIGGRFGDLDPTEGRPSTWLERRSALDQFSRGSDDVDDDIFDPLDEFEGAPADLDPEDLQAGVAPDDPMTELDRLSLERWAAEGPQPRQDDYGRRVGVRGLDPIPNWPLNRRERRALGRQRRQSATEALTRLVQDVGAEMRRQDAPYRSAQRAPIRDLIDIRAVAERAGTLPPTPAGGSGMFDFNTTDFGSTLRALLNTFDAGAGPAAYQDAVQRYDGWLKAESLSIEQVGRVFKQLARMDGFEGEIGNLPEEVSRAMFRWLQTGDDVVPIQQSGIPRPYWAYASGLKAMAQVLSDDTVAMYHTLNSFDDTESLMRLFPEAEWRQFLDAAMEIENDPMRAYFPQATRDPNVPQDAPDVDNLLDVGDVRSGTFMHLRRYKTYGEAFAQGMVPKYEDPLPVLLEEMVRRRHFMVGVSLITALQQVGAVRRMDDLTISMAKEMRVPKVGAPFEPNWWGGNRVDNAGIAVPNTIADALEELHGIHPQWNIPIPFTRRPGVTSAQGLGQRQVDLFAVAAEISDTTKLIKFFGAMYQPLDLMGRVMGAYLTPSDGLMRGKFLKLPRTYFNMLNTARKGTDARRESIEDFINDGAALIKDRPGVTRRGLVENGLQVGDSSIVIRRIQAHIPRILDELRKDMNPSMLVRFNQGRRAIETWMQEGMFLGFYQRAMLEVAEDSILPKLARSHRDWTDERLMRETANVANTMFSSMGPWQRFLGLGPRAKAMLKLPFISFNETRVWFRALSDSVPGFVPGIGNQRGTAEYFHQWWMGLFFGVLMLSGGLTWALNRRFPTREELQPLQEDPESRFGVSYGGQAMSPTILPGAGRGGRDVEIDLMQQTDTPWRVFKPADMLLSRASFPVRAALNQVNGSNFYGEPLDNPKKRISQLLLDTVIPVQLEQFAVAKWGSADKDGWIAPGEERLGFGPKVAQGFSGANLRPATNREYLDAEARREYGKTYEELEPYQRQVLRGALRTELSQAAETSERRGNDWGERQMRAAQLRLSRERQHVELTFDYDRRNTIQNRDERWATVNTLADQYWSALNEEFLRLDELYHGSDSPDQDVPEVLQRYREIRKKHVSQDGRFDAVAYSKEWTEFLEGLTGGERSYIARNTNFHVLDLTDHEQDKLLYFLRDVIPNEYTRVQESLAARKSHEESRQIVSAMMGR